MLNNDRQITISTAGSRRSKQWPASTMWWSELVERLRTPVRSTEGLVEYLRLPKSSQDDLKDVGGFVAGSLQDGRRKANTVTGRDVITLDIDNVPSGGTVDILRRVDALGCAYAIYSTRKHEETRPRLRVLLPLSRTCTADEYEPLARKVSSIIDPGMAIFDQSTFEVHRLMYWPSCCSDSQYVYQYGDKPFLDTDGVLRLYGNWHRVSEWAQVSGVQDTHQRLASKQGDPTEKPGVIGAFCRVYDIYRAMEELLSGTYIPCDIEDRYTFVGGSTTGGAIIYDHGKFLFSHHATDPAGGRLCNAFDLVRLHMFADKDDDAKPDTPINKMPSYVAMSEFAIADTAVASLLNTERYEKATEAFAKPLEVTDRNWINKLDLNGQGIPAKTLKNYKLIIMNDPNLAGKVRLNLFTGKVHVVSDLPWPRPTGNPLWSDSDITELRIYLEPFIGKSTRNDIDDSMNACAREQTYHPIRDYLSSLKWDGKHRLDTLFIDYLGAANTAYMKAVTRKSFVAAVARTMTPGIKYDTMPVLIGGQGRHKSTIIAKMGGEWFSDSLRNFDGKEAMETIQGTWLNEISEMQALEKSEVNAVKAFLSKQADYYREAYGRHVSERARQCVFFGTTNSRDCLTDTTGGRRFWPIDIDIQKRTKNVFSDLDNERDQLWAEAMVRWQLGETLHLPNDLEPEARTVQERHRERHPWEGPIEEFICKEVPENWSSWELDQRRMFFNGMAGNTPTLVERNRICAVEIWCEMLGQDKGKLTQKTTREINRLLERIPGWKSTEGARYAGAPYGKQRCFERDVINT